MKPPLCQVGDPSSLQHSFLSGALPCPSDTWTSQLRNVGIQPEVPRSGGSGTEPALDAGGPRLPQWWLLVARGGDADATLLSVSAPAQ